jgi:DNA invertase Pin-like site-specific DNA recombinase
VGDSVAGQRPRGAEAIARKRTETQPQAPPTVRPAGQRPTAAAYLRRSTPGQRASLESQHAEARAHAERQGYDLPLELVFRDTASGTRSDRQGFWRLLEAIDTGKVLVLLAWDLFRAGSNDLDAALLAMKCKEHGIRIEIVSTGGHYILENPDSKLQYRIMMALSDWRRENFLLTSDRGKRFLAPQGWWVQGLPPPGYGIDGPRGRKRLVQTAWAPVVRELFERYAAGASTIALAAFMRERNVPGRRWGPQAVCRLLDETTYVGYLRFRGNLYKGQHEPIVTQELWDQVQARREGQRERHPGRGGRSEPEGAQE